MGGEKLQQVAGSSILSDAENLDHRSRHVPYVDDTWQNDRDPANSSLNRAYLITSNGPIDQYKTYIDLAKSERLANVQCQARISRIANARLAHSV